VSTTELAEATPPAPAGPLTFEEAVRFAIAHDPDLLALRARAAAVNVGLVPQPVGVDAGVDMQRRPEAGLMIDAFSLLGIGPARADRALARARRSEVWMRHHEHVWELAATVAESFAVHRALADHAVPDVALPAEAYVEAGIEIEAVRTVAGATDAEVAAERRALAAETAKNAWVLLRRLGLPPTANLAIALPERSWPTVAPATTRAVLASRADLQRGLASYETADHELRKAVAAQVPSLVLTPMWSFDEAWLFGRVGLRLPVGAPGEARAALAAREAARHDLAGQVLDALGEAAAAREDAAVAAARLDAARRRAKASQEVFDAAKGRVELTGASLMDAAMAAEAAIAASRDLREAAVEEARARVRAARAQGWPAVEALR
jgi:outer membrane protein TolC